MLRITTSFKMRKLLRNFRDLSRYEKPAGALPLDLHVLGTPPAFILSQDQTLHKKEFAYFSRTSSEELNY